MIYSLRSRKYHLRISAVTLVLGLVVFFFSSGFHPSHEPAHVSELAFAEYARSLEWIDAHVGQFFGVLLIFLGFVSLSQVLKSDSEPASALSVLGLALATVGIALVGVLQSVDGPALKYMVDRWVAAPAAESDAAFRAAEAVRWIEVGVNSYFRISMGLVFALFGAALVVSRGLPRWLGWPALVGGVGTVGQGLYVGHHGFEVGSSLLAVPTLVTFGWVLVAAVVFWLRSNDSRSAPSVAGRSVGIAGTEARG